MNLISNQLSTASVKHSNWPSPVFGWFQNGCNKVVIEPRVVQFWSEIILALVCARLRSFALVWFWNHAYDFSPNCTPLSSITIIYRAMKKNVACPLWTTILYWFTELCVVEISQSTTKWSFHESKTNYCPQNIPPQLLPPLSSTETTCVTAD